MGDSIYPVVSDVVNEATAFGHLVTAEDTPIVNIEFSYNLHADIVSTRLNNGAASVDANRLKLSTGASANQSAQLLSKVPIKYYAGIGSKVIFVAAFPATPATNSTVIIGIGDNGDGYFFGYNGSALGIMSRIGGLSHVHSMTVTTKSSTVENITITLDGDSTGDTVAVTNGADVTVTANEIAAHDYSDVGKGWLAIADGDTVNFISFDAAAHADGGSQYTVTSTTDVVVSVAQVLLGVSSTDTWVAQTAWSDDKFDGTGASGVTLVPSNLNTYQIKYQWGGQVRFYIEHPADGELELVHTIDFSNTSVLPSVNNPTLPLCAVVSNESNTSDLVMYIISMAGFTEGQQPKPAVRHVSVLNKTFTTTTLVPAITLHNGALFQGLINRVKVKIINISIEVESGKPVLFELVKEPTLVAANYSAFDSATSVIEIDVAATSSIGGDILDAFTVASGSDKDRPEEVLIEPHEHLTLEGAQASGGANSVCKIIIEWEEDF